MAPQANAATAARTTVDLRLMPFVGRSHESNVCPARFRRTILFRARKPPAPFAGSPRTMSVSKRGPVVFVGLAPMAAVAARSPAAEGPEELGGLPECATSSLAAPALSAQTPWTNL